jgi:hypothetical protein
MLVARMPFVLENKNQVLKEDGVKVGSENWVGFLSVVAISTILEKWIEEVQYRYFAF